MLCVLWADAGADAQACPAQSHSSINTMSEKRQRVPAGACSTWRVALALCLSLVAVSAMAVGLVIQNQPQIKLTWDASPDDGVSYRLYVINTNTLNLYTNFGVGTNLTASIDGMAGGQWKFYVTAVASNSIESLPSNVLPQQVPTAPGNFRNVVIQYSTNLSNGKTDAGFFQLYLP